MITIYDHGAHIPLLWTHLIPATLEGRAIAQRAERDVRRGDGLQHGRQARGHPPRPPHLRHHLLPGAGPDERVRRASLQGDPRLRPQSRRGARRCASWWSGSRSKGRRSSWCSPRRATGATRTSARSAASAPGHFDHYICRRDDQPARPGPGRGAPRCCGRRSSPTGCRPAQIACVPEEPAAIEAALRAGQPGDLVLIFGDQITRSWKQVIQFKPGRRPERAFRPDRRIVEAPPLAEPVLLDSDHLVRDERGVRLAREAGTIDRPCPADDAGRRPDDHPCRFPPAARAQPAVGSSRRRARGRLPARPARAVPRCLAGGGTPDARPARLDRRGARPPDAFPTAPASR